MADGGRQDRQGGDCERQGHRAGGFRIVFKPHSEKQERAIFSERPLVVLGTGIQFGKTTVGALRMKRAIHTYTAPEDNFLIVAPTYKILQQSTLPAFLKVMEGCGQYNKVDAVFVTSWGTNVYFRTATDPDSIVGITNVRAIWGDEAGLFGLYFWENVQARAAFREAPITLTTSPYTLNWLFKEIIRPKTRDPASRPDVELVQAASWENPYMPKGVIERARISMDARRFNALFGGMWERMAGLVYDCFDEVENQCDPLQLGPGTRYVGGIDWGYTEPFVFKIRAITPDGMQYGIHEFYKTGLTITDIGTALVQRCLTYPVGAIYCGPDQPGLIDELTRILKKGGTNAYCVPAKNDVRVGIDRHYQLLKTRRLKYFRGHNPYTIDEIDTYHYPEPDDLKPDDNVKDQKPVQQHDHACFSAETRVLTITGEKPIADVAIGDLVLTPFGPKPVVASGSTGARKVMEARFTDGRTLVLTEDHPVFVYGKGFVPLDAERYGAMVSTCANPSPASLSKASTITGMAAIGRLLAAVRTVENAFMWLSGKMRTDPSQRAFTSTIATTTGRTTIYPIWNFCHDSNTSASMGANDLLSLGLMQSGFDRSLRRGTEAPRDERGIESTRNTPFGRRSIGSSAKAAESISNPSDLVPRIARTAVRLALGIRAALMTWKSRVKSVLSLSRRTDTPASEPVRLLALSPLHGVREVFNLKVEDAGCFYAEGVLVSNCDAERYISVMVSDGSVLHKPFVPEEKGREEDQYKRIERLKRRPRTGNYERWS